MIQTDRVALQHGKRLQQHIIEHIATKEGRISFSEYMQLALYAPGLGYYNAGTIKFGASGDFITAPELGSLFAKCVAAQFKQIFSDINAANILELGAGSGQLACDLLLELDQQNVPLENYYILELSADLRMRQQEQILQRYPQYKHLIHWIDHLPRTPFNGIIFANEVIDAMPVTRFHFANDLLQEYFVTVNDECFAELLEKPSKNLAAAFAQTNIANYISQPYTSEINLWLSPWIKSLNACLNSGAILLCDYGFPRAEYYHPQRNNGTLMCHYQHRCHNNPFVYIGLQDITAHVDFTAVAEAAHDCGLSIAGYTNLASFLINCDITKFIQAPSMQQVQELNMLTSPAEMGELFKCIALTKNTDLPLLGFQRHDKSHCL